MQARLRHLHGIGVDRETVRIILLYLDPEGVQARRQHSLVRRMYISKGPNYLMHIDGWDKLKRYGLAVHGCIDGFSRRIMWLEASRSNNDPFQICHYFCQMVTEINGLPHIIRSDRGTENVNIQMLQRLLRAENDDDRSRRGTTYLYGKSTSNQRIESWWSRFPAMGMSAWMNHFHELELHGIIDTSSKLHIELIRYCYMDLLRTELLKVQITWNTHHIRPVASSRSPCGKPDILYHFPRACGARSYLKDIDIELFNDLSALASDQLPHCVTPFKELFDSVRIDYHITTPTSLAGASRILALILDVIEDEMQTLL